MAKKKLKRIEVPRPRADDASLKAIAARQERIMHALGVIGMAMFEKKAMSIEHWNDLNTCLHGNHIVIE